MRLRGRDLRAGLTGEDVAALHDELRRLSLSVPEQDVARQLFGVGTAAVVAAFQKAHGLVDSSQVDDATAAALERAVRALPVPPENAPVTAPPAGPDSADAADRDSAEPDDLEPADPESADPESADPESADPDSAEPDRAEPAGPHDAERADPDRAGPAVSPAIGRAAAAAPVAVRGRLTDPDGGPAGDVRVRLYTRSFGGRATLVGEAVTDAKGRYTIPGALAAKPARLDIRVVGADGTETALLSPDRVVDPREPVELTVPAGRVPPPAAEHGRLLADLSAHLDGGRLGDAREDDDRRDITLLHEATGWDARIVALGVAADRLAEQTGVTVEAAYGMARAGLPADPVQLARISPAGAGHALRAAVKARLVSLTPAQIEAAQAAVDRFGRRTRRKLAVNGTASSYGAMLAATGLDAAGQDRFDEIFSAHTGDAATLWWQAAEAGLPADRLKLTAQLGVLTLNSARLVEDLRQQAGSTERLAAALVADGLYEASAWADRLRALAGGNDRVLGQLIPPVYQGSALPERLAAYTRDLAYKVRRSYPTQILAHRFRTGQLPARAADDVATVLDRAAEQGFVPGRQPWHAFVRDDGGHIFEGLPGDRAEAVADELKTLHRQYQITVSDEGLLALRRAGLNSATQVSALPEAAFLAAHGSAFPSAAEAALTWRRAQQVSAVALNVVTSAKQLGTARLIPALMPAGEAIVAARAELVAQFPTLESLFGSLDFAECTHCQSVLSPAAYLVDLLKFLDDAPAVPSSPYDALTQRRPDLPHLPLTCENTNTVLPYIDVVNEILEFFLVHDGQLTAQAAYDTGATSAEDLLAEPQNLLPEAYELLKQARYPIGAPFDLWLATVRAFTAHFEVPFWNLLDALRTSDEPAPASGYGYAAVAYERLGFGPDELAVLTAADALAAWPQLYGLETADTAQLTGAPDLARRLGVTYHELVALLRTGFGNPGPDPLVLAGDGAEPGDDGWEHTVLRRAGGDAAAPLDFVLLNLLVRVWRRLGWTIAETDRALSAFLPAEPDPRTATTIGPALASALLGVAHLDRLGAGQSATVRRDLPVLWAPLSDDRYADLFLTGSLQIRDPVFDGEPGDHLTTPGTPLAGHEPTVRAALRLSSGDLDRILAAAGLEPATAPLDMATVSLLYRHAVLARLLGLDVAELLTLRMLTGLDPFAPPATAPVTTAEQDRPMAQTLRFVTVVRAVQAAGLSVADLDYLLRHRFEPAGPYRFATLPPLALVRTLTAGIARINREYAAPADPLTFTDEIVARTVAAVFDPPVAAVFLAGWTGAEPLPDGFFAEHLRRQALPGVGEVGFLDDDDAGVLFTPAPGDQAAEFARRARLAATLLPYVRRVLVGRLVVATVADDRDADPELVEALLTEPALLDDPEQPGAALFDGYLAAGTGGLTVGDGSVSGYFEVPATGGYLFGVRGPAGAEVLLRMDHLTEPVLDDAAEPVPADLRAGTVYGFTFEHSDGAVLTVRSQRLPETGVERLVTYPRTEVDRLHRLHLILGKALWLAGRLGLTLTELRHLITQRNDFAGLDLGALPARPQDATAPQVRVLFDQLSRLLDYTALRTELAADPADLVATMRAARGTVPDGVTPADAEQLVVDRTCAGFAAITRRAPATVRAAADAVGLTATTSGGVVTFAGGIDERGLGRIWRVLQLSARIGADPATLRRWATAGPDQTTARDVRDTVRATVPADVWRRIARPIFDELRQRRRDALVAQALRVTGYDWMEQLFEHFLIDPGAEPVVQTSRLRLAIASVQTFVQRCLLNLEPAVAPEAINSARWEWMRRYRVWEANRKIFLWPENWLEPELRDDKTHLFQALESELLESDLDDDAVEAALQRYLTGLEEIARLDVRAVFRQAGPDPAGDVLHVVARTTTSPHRYYYRTWSYRSWTPWSKVGADVAGDHVTLAYWRGRVHLFWVTFAEQAEAHANPESRQKATAELTVGELTAMKPRRRVEIRLYWSSLLRGEWGEPVLATPEHPVVAAVPDSFQARDVFVWTQVFSNGQAQVNVLGGIDRAFRLTSRHFPPENFSAAQPVPPPYLTGDELPLTRAGQGRWRGDGPRFAVHVEGETVVDTVVTPCDITADVLSRVPGRYRLVITPPPALTKFKSKLGPQARPEDPFFYLDAEHTFFVEPAWTEMTIPLADQAVVAQLPVWHEFDDPEFWAGRRLTPAWPEVAGDDLLTRPEAVIALDGGTLIGPAGTVRPDGRLSRIGPHGALLRTDLEVDR